MKRVAALKNGWGPSLAVSALGPALLVVAVACSGTGGQAAGHWQEAALTLPPGMRYATYDATRDVIWMLTWPRGAQDGALLTSFHSLSGESQTSDVALPTARMGAGAGLAVDGEGMVWAAWGRTLVIFDPDRGEFQYRTIPDPDPSLVEGVDVGLDGFVVDLALAPDGRLWLALHSVRAAYGFDPATGQWQTVETSPLAAATHTKLTVSGDGTVLLNGVLSPGGAYALARIDPQAGTAELTPHAALAYVETPAGDLAYLQPASQAGAVEVVSEALASARAVSQPFDGIAPPLLSVATDVKGNLWFWRYERYELDIIRVDTASGETSTFPYPLVIASPGDKLGPGLPGGFMLESQSPRPVAMDPGIQALIVDQRGDLWVLSDDGSAPPVTQGVYPALYRLHVE